MLLKKIYLWSMLLFFVLPAKAQNSYIYIELIKTIPCKVIQNGTEILPSNKNFVVLDVLDTREQNIDIVFGAELFPKQNFVIDAVKNAGYAYKLAKSGESSFYLLDLVNNGKIVESNSVVNMGLATPLNTINFGGNQKVRKNIETKKVASEGWVQKLFKRRPNNSPVVVNKKAPVQKVPIEKKKSPLKRKDEKSAQSEVKTPPQYGVVAVLNSNDTKEIRQKQNLETNNSKRTSEVQKNANQQVKSGCYLAASDREIESFVEKLHAKSDDETKLLLLRKKQFTGCLTVNQIMHIADDFSTQYGKYNLVRIAIPYISNLQDILQCESLFKTEGYKNKFSKLINPQE